MHNIIIHSYLLLVYFACGGLFLDADTELAEESCQCKMYMALLLRLHFQPIYLYGSNHTVIYPDKPGNAVATLNTGDDVEVHCTGRSGILIGGDRFPNISSLTLRCMYERKFQTGDLGMERGEVDVHEIQCLQPIFPATKRTNRNCGRRGKRIDVGFKLSGNRFLRQYTVCFNYDLMTTEYAFSVLRPKGESNKLYKYENSNAQVHFNLSQSVSRYYLRNAYIKAIDRQLNRSSNSFFIANCGLFVYKYYLVSPVHMYYDFERAAAMFYINIAPHFSGVPWYIINRFIHMYMLQKNVELHVYTGSLQVAKVSPYVGSASVPLYLDDKNQKVPIPALIWHTLYDPKHEAGVAIIAINNYLLRGRYRTLCKDISPLLPFLNDNTRKYVYACTYSAWYQIVRDVIPTVRITSILGQNLVFPSPPWKKRERYFRKSGI